MLADERAGRPVEGDPVQWPRKAHKGVRPALRQWRLRWGPTGQTLGVVEAATATDARRQAPLPYRKYLGEIGVDPL